MANKDQFISAVTDEAMQRICYDENHDGNGWKLTPIQFAISSKDPLEGWTDAQIWDENGKVKPEVYELLHDMISEDMNGDSNIWYESRFSGITPAGEGIIDDGTEEGHKKDYAKSSALTHHLVIPPNALPEGQTGVIKTIYFVYIDANESEPYLFAVARATNYLVYEAGVTQSFFFNFTVANTDEQTDVSFDVRYSYPLELEDHNQHPSAHANLVARDGSRTITQPLEYTSNVNIKTATENSLSSKKYVDDKLGDLEEEFNNRERVWVTNSNGQRIKPKEITIVQQSNIPSGFVKETGEYLLFTTPAMPYIPYNEAIKSTSHLFQNGGAVLATNSCSVTLFAGEPHSITFNNIVGYLPVMKGTNVTATREVYFVDNA